MSFKALSAVSEAEENNRTSGRVPLSPAHFCRGISGQRLRTFWGNYSRHKVWISEGVFSEITLKKYNRACLLQAQSAMPYKMLWVHEILEHCSEWAKSCLNLQRAWSMERWDDLLKWQRFVLSRIRKPALKRHKLSSFFLCTFLLSLGFFFLFRSLDFSQVFSHWVSDCKSVEKEKVHGMV